MRLLSEHPSDASLAPPAEMNVTFGFLFAFKHQHRNVDVSLYYKQTDDSIWVIVRG